MFAINHAATALVLKKQYPKISLIWLLLSVQFIELLWVALNFLGIETTTTDAMVRSVANIHLAHMPFSHSLLLTAGIAVVAWLGISKGFNKPTLGVAVGLGIFSHILLDVLTHTPDIAVFPFADSPKWGLGLYSIPLMGFIAEMLYGVWCWWVFKGSRILLAMIVLFNVMNVSFFTALIPGPETLLANHPLIITALIFFQIVVTLVLVGILAKNKPSVVTQPHRTPRPKVPTVQ